MTTFSPEQRIDLDPSQEALKIQELLTPFESSVDTSRWTNLGINSGGFLTATIPLDQINPSTFPINHEHSAKIARDMKDESDKTGGTGQRDSINLVTVIGENGLEITDGFHRHDATVINSNDVIHAVLTPNISIEELIDLRIAATRKFDLEMARVVELAQDAWELTEWAKIEGLDIVAAFHLHATKSDGKRYGLSSEIKNKMFQWMAEKEIIWGLPSKQVHAHLKGAGDHEPEVVEQFRQLGEKGELGFTPQAADKIVPLFKMLIEDEEFIDMDLVILIAETANNLKLTLPQSVHLARLIYDAPSYEAAVELALSYEPPAKIPTPSNRIPRLSSGKKSSKQTERPVDPTDVIQEIVDDTYKADTFVPKNNGKPVTIEDIFKRTPNYELLEILGDAINAFKDRYRKGDVLANEHNNTRIKVLGSSIVGLVREADPNAWGNHRGDYGTNLLVNDAVTDIANYIMHGGHRKPNLPVQQSQQTSKIIGGVGKIFSGKELDSEAQKRMADFAGEWHRRFKPNQPS